MGHLVAVDNPRCVKEIGTVIQRNLNLVQGRPREAGSRDDVFVSRDFLDNGIDKGRLAHIGHADHIDITALAMAFDFLHQLLDGLLVLGRSQDHIDRSQSHLMGPFCQPLGHLAVLDGFG